MPTSCLRRVFLTFFPATPNSSNQNTNVEDGAVKEMYLGQIVTYRKKTIWWLFYAPASKIFRVNHDSMFQFWITAFRDEARGKVNINKKINKLEWDQCSSPFAASVTLSTRETADYDGNEGRECSRWRRQSEKKMRRPSVIAPPPPPADTRCDCSVSDPHLNPHRVNVESPGMNLH